MMLTVTHANPTGSGHSSRLARIAAATLGILATVLVTSGLASQPFLETFGPAAAWASDASERAFAPKDRGMGATMKMGLAVMSGDEDATDIAADQASGMAADAASNAAAAAVEHGPAIVDVAKILASEGYKGFKEAQASSEEDRRKNYEGGQPSGYAYGGSSPHGPTPHGGGQLEQWGYAYGGGGQDGPISHGGSQHEQWGSAYGQHQVAAAEAAAEAARTQAAAASAAKANLETKLAEATEAAKAQTAEAIAAKANLEARLAEAESKLSAAAEAANMETAEAQAAKAEAEALAQKMQKEAAAWKAKAEAASIQQAGYGQSQGHVSLPAGWASKVVHDGTTDEGRTYYYCSAEHPVGGKKPPSQWGRPKEPCELPAGWASTVVHDGTADEGRTYYYCSAEQPIGGKKPPSQWKIPTEPCALPAGWASAAGYGEHRGESYYYCAAVPLERRKEPTSQWERPTQVSLRSRPSAHMVRRRLLTPIW